MDKEWAQEVAQAAAGKARKGTNDAGPDVQSTLDRTKSMGFWGNLWNPEIIDELAAPDMLLQYSLHAPRHGSEVVRNFIEGFRAAYPDLNFWGAAELIAEGDYVVGRWEGGGTHTGPAFSDFLIGSLPAASGRKMRFTGT